MSRHLTVPVEALEPGDVIVDAFNAKHIGRQVASVDVRPTGGVGVTFTDGTSVRRMNQRKGDAVKVERKAN